VYRKYKQSLIDKSSDLFLKVILGFRLLLKFKKVNLKKAKQSHFQVLYEIYIFRNSFYWENQSWKSCAPNLRLISPKMSFQEILC